MVVNFGLLNAGVFCIDFVSGFCVTTRSRQARPWVNQYNVVLVNEKYVSKRRGSFVDLCLDLGFDFTSSLLYLCRNAFSRLRATPKEYTANLDDSDNSQEEVDSCQAA